MEGNEYGVTFHGDYFSLTVNVQGVEVNEGDDHFDVAADLAANILKHHYGWDVKAVSHEIDVYCEYADDPSRRTTDMARNEYECDRCGTEVPNGSGHYPEGTDDRVCADCYKEDNLACTSDDPNNHQGDTCPIHEA